MSPTHDLQVAALPTVTMAFLASLLWPGAGLGVHWLRRSQTIAKKMIPCLIFLGLLSKARHQAYPTPHFLHTRPNPTASVLSPKPTSSQQVCCSTRRPENLRPQFHSAPKTFNTNQAMEVRFPAPRNSSWFLRSSCGCFTRCYSAFSRYRWRYR